MFRWAFILVLALAACKSPAARVTPATGEPPGAAQLSLTPTAPAAWVPVRPTPVMAAPVFPSCEPDDLPPYQFTPGIPIASPTVLAGPARPSLRLLAQAKGMYIGSASDPGYLGNPEYASLLANQFNLIAVEVAMKWEVIHPQADRYDFTPGDALVNFARTNDMAVYGQALVWDLQQPVWLTGGQHSRDEWIQILCKHIKTVVHHYRGQIYAWVVVNEALQDNGALRDTHWLRAIGPEHIPMAFQWAHEADPDALLIYNENGAEGLNKKSQAVYSLVQGLLQAGIPVHGVGLQMHVFLDGPPVQQELIENMRRLEQLGLYAHITEMDVRTHFSPGSPAKKAADQAQTYRRVMAACLQAPNCNVFAVWGLTDRHSWVPGFFGYPDAPTLFDEQGRPKPAYEQVYQLLAGP